MFTKSLALLASLILVAGTAFAITPSDGQVLPHENQLLVNGGFENATVGWSASTGTYTVQTATKLAGKSAASWVLSAASGTLSQSVASPGAGITMESSCWVNTTASTFQVCSMSAGVAGSCTAVPSTGQWTLVSAPLFSSPSSGTVGVQVSTTGSTTGTAFVDQCYVGTGSAQQVNSMSDWVSAGVNTITAITTNPTKGTTSTDILWYRRVGQNMEVRIEYAQSAAGTAGSGDYLFAIPSPYIIDTTKVTAFGGVSIGNGNGATGALLMPSTVGFHTSAGTSTQSASGPVVVYDSTHVRLLYPYAGDGSTTTVSHGAIGSVFGGAGGTTVRYSATYSVPIQGWTSNTAAARPDQTNYDWTSYTPTFQGWGTVTTLECKHKRESADLLVRCKITIGTRTASQIQISLPNSLTIDSGKASTLQLFGDLVYGTAATGTKYNIIGQGGNSYVGVSFNGNGAFVLANGTDLMADATTNGFNFRVPITTWAENGKAATLSGSLTSNAIGALHFESFTAGNSAGTCGITSQSTSGFFTNSAGTNFSTNCSYTYPAFSSPPVCWFSNSGMTSGQACRFNGGNVPTTTGFTIDCPSNTLLNVQVVCVGFR